MKRIFLISISLVALLAPALAQTIASDWINQSIALDDQGNFDDALQAIDKAIQLESEPFKGAYLITSPMYLLKINNERKWALIVDGGLLNHYKHIIRSLMFGCNKNIRSALLLLIVQPWYLNTKKGTDLNYDKD